MAVASVEGVQGWSRLSAAIGGQAILPAVEELHFAISDGVIRWLGPLSSPVRRVHDRVVGGVYDATRIGLTSIGEVGELVATHLGEADVEPSGRALKARASAQGALSQELLAGSPGFDPQVTLRVGGHQVQPDHASLQAAYPEATGVLTVFVHGLLDSEEVWAPRTADDADLPSVVAATGSTPLLVRYGTGRAIGRNGAELAQLLEEVTQAWPVPVTRILVVGHSMGGLVARAACATAAAHDHAWLSALSDVVYLGTPHLGSWLEKVVNVAGFVARRSSTRAAPVVSVLEHRSRGIKDLRHGTVVEDAWAGASPDDLLSGLVPDAPWLRGVTHHLVVGQLRPSAMHPLNTVFGDTLVRSASARGSGRRRRVGAGGPVVISEVGASHTALMRHPTVGTLLTEVATAA